ncbi:MAG TPA: hypothetical protein VG756_03340 [Pseudonocardiaceae bacterium]|nr:hypothetical protein [Pseudonocardiaceae bacterium]
MNNSRKTSNNKAERRAAAAAAVAAARKADKRNRYLWTGGGLVAIVALVVVLTVVLTNHNSTASTAGGATGAGPTVVPDHPMLTAAGRTTQAPWPVPADVTAAVHKAGLPMLGAEGTAEHIHVHLDITVDGRAVTVPQLVGIDETAGSISPLHTHDTSGVIHIESPKVSTFSLGQFFTEWDVTLSATQLGGYPTGNGNSLRAYVNGKQVSGDPAAITFTAHDEIALVYGPADAKANVPGSYNWPAGL